MLKILEGCRQNSEVSIGRGSWLDLERLLSVTTFLNSGATSILTF